MKKRETRLYPGMRASNRAVSEERPVVVVLV